MMINGANSFQKDYLKKGAYLDALPHIKEEQIVQVEGAGHGLLFDKPIEVRNLLH